MKCDRCGKEISGEELLCPFCGCPVERAPQTAGGLAEEAQETWRLEEIPVFVICGITRQVKRELARYDVRNALALRNFEEARNLALPLRTINRTAFMIEALRRLPEEAPRAKVAPLLLDTVALEDLDAKDRKVLARLGAGSIDDLAAMVESEGLDGLAVRSDADDIAGLASFLVRYRHVRKVGAVLAAARRRLLGFNPDFDIFPIGTLRCFGFPERRLAPLGLSTIADLRAIPPARFPGLFRDQKPLFEACAALRGRTDEIFSKVIDRIPAKRLEIALLRIEGRTLAQIGDELKVSRERVRQIESGVALTLKPLIDGMVALLCEGKPYFKTREARKRFGYGRDTTIALYFARFVPDLEYLDFAGTFARRRQDGVSWLARTKEIFDSVLGRDKPVRLSEKLDELFRRLDEDGMGFINLEDMMSYLKGAGYDFKGKYVCAHSISIAEIIEEEVRRHFPDGIRLTQGRRSVGAGDYDELRELAKKDFDFELSSSSRAICAAAKRDGLDITLIGKGLWRTASHLDTDLGIIDAVLEEVDREPGPTIHYKEIFNAHREEMEQAGIENPQMLHGVLKHNYPDRYQYRRDYIVRKDSPVAVDRMTMATRLRIFMREAGRPATVEEIKAAIGNFADTSLTQYMGISNEYCYFGKSYWMLVENVSTTDEEKRDLRRIVTEETAANKGYCSSGMVFRRIEDSMPGWLERNGLESDFKVFSVLSKLLNDGFDFSRPHITVKNLIEENASYDSVIAMLAEDEKVLSAKLGEEISARFLWPQVYAEIAAAKYLGKTCVRISNTQYAKLDSLALSPDVWEDLDRHIRDNMTWGYYSLMGGESELDLPWIKHPWSGWLVRGLAERGLIHYTVLKIPEASKTDPGAVLVPFTKSRPSYPDFVADLLLEWGIRETDEETLVRLLSERGLAEWKLPKKLRTSPRFAFEDGRVAVRPSDGGEPS